MMFGVIGLMRGWTKEILVTASIILGLFILEQFGVYILPLMVNTTGIETIAVDPNSPLRRVVMFKAAILLIVTFFGYQGPTLVHFASRGRVGAKARETLQEGLLVRCGGIFRYTTILLTGLFRQKTSPIPPALRCFATCRYSGWGRGRCSKCWWWYSSCL